MILFIMQNLDVPETLVVWSDRVDNTVAGAWTLTSADRDPTGDWTVRPEGASPGWTQLPADHNPAGDWIRR